nr:hypothetical protein [Pyxidicoccus caerfyrddinensis]
MLLRLQASQVLQVQLQVLPRHAEHPAEGRQQAEPIRRRTRLCLGRFGIQEGQQRHRLARGLKLECHLVRHQSAEGPTSQQIGPARLHGAHLCEVVARQGFDGDVVVRLGSVQAVYGAVAAQLAHQFGVAPHAASATVHEEEGTLGRVPHVQQHQVARGDGRLLHPPREPLHRGVLEEDRHR